MFLDEYCQTLSSVSDKQSTSVDIGNVVNIGRSEREEEEEKHIEQQTVLSSEFNHRQCKPNIC
jgi:hypothetical protein